MNLKLSLTGLAATLAIGCTLAWACSPPSKSLLPEWNPSIRSAFSQENLTLSDAQITTIRPLIESALASGCKTPRANSQFGFNAVEIVDLLKLDPKLDNTLVDRVTNAITTMSNNRQLCQNATHTPLEDRVLNASWEEYYQKTLALNGDETFLRLVAEKQFSPVKISWEDIGRWENSVWGDRISDVGIWVRKNEASPESAELALSVRRDQNYRDKVLVVPIEKIKIHTKQGSRTVETNLKQRLAELGLTSKTKDQHVIVSNQFAIVPVPSKTMSGAWKPGTPPRAAFNFSIYPYGSTNFVITDVIEGSSNAIVGPGQHQLLYANINGKKAPFTASRAEDRQDLMKLEANLKAQGMDVDVQRYYLIQIPLKSGTSSVELSNMGTPPTPRYTEYPMAISGAAMDNVSVASPNASGGFGTAKMKSASKPDNEQKDLMKQEAGLAKVAIGHGDSEGFYNTGKGWKNQRADEPIRVTVVYFVTPKGSVTQQDMTAFTKAFEAWDQQAIWGGSFVVKEKKS